MAMLILDKVYFTAEKITREEHSIMIKGQSTKKSNNHKRVHTKLQSCRTCRAEIDRTNRRNRQIRRYSLRF